jgi:GMP synthase-like glutamine amidotransferase
MYLKKTGPEHVLSAITELGYNPIVYDPHTVDIATTITNSKIKYWVFTGADRTVKPGNPMVPIDTLDAKVNADKRFFLICYSMESALNQLGHKLHDRTLRRKEIFQLPYDIDRATHQDQAALFANLPNPMTLWRNHSWFVVVDPKSPAVIATYQNETMLYLRKNAVMTQFHPERTKDGKQMILNWLQAP